MKSGTVAIVVHHPSPLESELVDVVSDDREVELLETVFESAGYASLELIYDHRERTQREDEAFGDYVERLLSQPFVRTEVQEHGLRWFRSRIRMEEFRRNEMEAAKVIAGFAMEIYRKDRSQTDFTLEGMTAKVRVRIFELKADALDGRAKGA
jgi:hypothetical protein